MVLAAQDLIPPATADPTGVWFFNWVIPIAGSIFIVLAIADVVRRRRLTWGFLFLFNSMAVYWMETTGDWGQMLFYSPAFAEHHLLDWLPLKTPNDPLFVLWLSQWVSSRFGWSMLKSMIVLAIPVNYVWDFVVEGTATAMGWWTYDPGIGPVLEWDSGGRITLLWTIGIMCTWPNLIAYWAGKPPVRGLNHLERFVGLDRFTQPKVPVREPASITGSGGVAVAAQPVRLTKTQEFDDFLNYEVTIARWKFELMRLSAWFVGFQVTFLAFLVGPLIILRAALGADSPFVP
jgi:hypothetical protein